MIAVESAEYRSLERSSSNLLMEWDAKSGLGWYEEAAFAAWKAGEQRRHMAQLCLDDGDHAQAAADALSSAACYFAASAAEPACGALRLAQRLETEGRIPTGRRDIIQALGERALEVEQLEAKVDDWKSHNADVGTDALEATEVRLAALRQQRRELPGLGLLHFGIFQVAVAMGKDELAREHLQWAVRFDPSLAELANQRRTFQPTR